MTTTISPPPQWSRRRAEKARRLDQLCCQGGGFGGLWPGWLPGIASLLLALTALRATRTTPKLNVEVSFTADEETDSVLGAGWLVDHLHGDDGDQGGGDRRQQHRARPSGCGVGSQQHGGRPDRGCQCGQQCGAGSGRGGWSSGFPPPSRRSAASNISLWARITRE